MTEEDIYKLFRKYLNYTVAILPHFHCDGTMQVMLITVIGQRDKALTERYLLTEELLEDAALAEEAIASRCVKFTELLCSRLMNNLEGEDGEEIS